MKTKPLVSIIMNCHNGEKYLRKSLNSLIGQTYKNWELIFWNNCSSDKSKKIIKSFNDKRIRYFESSNLLKLYNARNLAIKRSKGEFISFLDTDDWWLKSKIQQQVQIFEKNKDLSFLYSNCYQYNQKLKKKYLYSTKVLPSGQITQKLLDDYRLGIVTVMLRRDIFKKKKFNNKYNIIGDFDFFLNLSINYEMRCIQKPLAYYRVHSSNYSTTHLSNYEKEMHSWFRFNSKKFKLKGFSINKLKMLNYKIKIKNFFQKFKL